jgi:hypothetical protein
MQWRHGPESRRTRISEDDEIIDPDRFASSDELAQVDPGVRWTDDRQVVDVDQSARVVKAVAHHALDPRLGTGNRSDCVQANVFRHGIRQRKAQELRCGDMREGTEWRQHGEGGATAVY